MGGHVFIVAADLTRLFCDAWLVPTDEDFMVEPPWLGALDEADLARTADAGWDGHRAVLCAEGAGRPSVWLGRVAGRGNRHQVGACLEEFVRSAAERVRERAPDRRMPPVLAVNAIGTRWGGWSAEKGEAYLDLIEVLQRLAADHDADVVLACWGPKAYSAAQSARRSVLGPGLDAWDLTDPSLREEAGRLARFVTLRQLTLFLGAGASAGAGLPTWQTLLSQAAERLGIAEDDRARLAGLDVRDQAQVLANRSAEPGGLGRVVGDLLGSERYSLTQALLASLDCAEAVTTNFDEHYETAVTAAHGEDRSGAALAVLPWASVKPGVEKWLLKLHGTVGRELTLTRADYLGLTKTHGALFGIVQALLLTRHMLFVGYSMNDEDFHQLVQEVLDARISAEEAPKMGTVLTLFADDLLDDLRGGDLFVVSMLPAREAVGADDIASAGRELQIFLDLVGYLSASGGEFLLDGTYDGLLTDGDRRIVEALGVVAEAAREQDSPVAEIVRAFLGSVGARPRPAR